MLARCLITAALVWTGCTFESTSDPADETAPVAVRGRVVDFQTGDPVAIADLTISGVSPLPQVERDGASFTLAGVARNSAFGLLAVAAGHRSTLSQVVVTDGDVDGLEAPVVADAFLAGLASAFGVAPSPTRGIVLLHLVDAAGKARAGVAAVDFTIAGTGGPHFLDANLMPAAAANASSASGWVVFFDVPTGLAGLSQALTATTTIDMPTLPVAANVVTVVEGRVSDGAPALPSNVRFGDQIVPIFTARGCVACHTGDGGGKQDGNLTLGGSAKLIYRELVEERPDLRVRRAMPESSLVLTMPSREDPPDPHPTVVFTGPRDPDYLKLLVWIREGAKQN